MSLLIWMLSLMIVADINLALVCSSGVGMGWLIIGLLWVGIRKLTNSLYKKVIEPKMNKAIVCTVTVFLIAGLYVLHVVMVDYISSVYDPLVIGYVMALAVGMPYIMIGLLILGLIIYGISCIVDKTGDVVEVSKYKRYLKKTIAHVNEENIKLLCSLSAKDIQKGEGLVDNSGRVVKKPSTLKDMANKVAAEGDAELSLAVDKETLLPYKVLKFRETGERMYLKTTYEEINRCIEMNDDAFIKYKILSRENIKEKL